MDGGEEKIERYHQGEVVELKANGIFVIRLDDGRVLPQCYIARRGIGRRTNVQTLLPKIGQRVWIEESPYEPGHARMFLNKIPRGS